MITLYDIYHTCISTLSSYAQADTWNSGLIYQAIYKMQFDDKHIYQWLSVRLQYLQCFINGGTAVLHKAIDMWWSLCALWWDNVMLYKTWCYMISTQCIPTELLAHEIWCLCFILYICILPANLSTFSADNQWHGTPFKIWGNNVVSICNIPGVSADNWTMTRPCSSRPANQQPR